VSLFSLRQVFPRLGSESGCTPRHQNLAEPHASDGPIQPKP
jgi:hypothetical protein